MQRTIQEAADICGIQPDAIEQAAEWIGKANGFLSFWTMGLNQSVIGVNKNLSLINLHLITGKISKPGNGPFSLTGQPNAMGGRETGGLANGLPGHREVLRCDAPGGNGKLPGKVLSRVPINPGSQQPKCSKRWLTIG
ncbi:molybdopterin-dependent oxidoreductase [Paucibacter sp. O1-1]|nr:molybdopterin-dependent oxidoreductase [Paucibacter sp. O1-1]MDA3830109.1 molybdopterin-dependent oxidoreductase [Paucibacter sp. O1-1]